MLVPMVFVTFGSPFKPYVSVVVTMYDALYLWGKVPLKIMFLIVVILISSLTIFFFGYPMNMITTDFIEKVNSVVVIVH